MLIGIFGTPSPLTYWTVHALRAIAEVCWGDYLYVETWKATELNLEVANRGGRNVLYFHDSPERAVCDIFLRSRSPFIACIEDPVDVLGYCIRARSISPVDAMRFTFHTTCALHDFILAPNALVMRRASGAMIRDAVAEIMKRFMIAADTAAREEIARRLGGDESDSGQADVESALLLLFAQARPIGHGAPDIDADDRNGILSAVRCLDPIVKGVPIDSIRWGGGIFLDPFAPESPPAFPLDLLGPARHLVFGPFLYLPRGRWRVSVSFVIEENLSGNTLTVDVAILGAIVAMAEFRAPTAGAFSLDLTFDNEEPRSFIEVRVWMNQGAIEGHFKFLSADFQRIK